MIILMNAATTEQVNRVLDKLRQLGLDSHLITGLHSKIIMANGDLSVCNPALYERMPGVDKVLLVETPYKLASREFQREDTIVTVGCASFGGKTIPVIAGPCAIESYDQLYQAGVTAKAAGAAMLRGGAYKPRTSPYSFQGLEKKGLEIIKAVGRELELPVVSEVTDPRSIDLFAEHVDMLQIGTRNMQNFVLLKEVALSKKPILLKRGLAATIEEWLMAAEYIMASGNNQIVLCERGIRTYETFTRNTLDLTAIPVIKHVSHLPVIADPSHGTGSWRWVNPMSKAAIAAGADGLLIEMHPNPEEALSDGPQSLTPENFSQLMTDLDGLTGALGRLLYKNKGE
ncbi:3-deoxy-7-phosphoheptulonate synthase [Sporomusa acidovorans]|uniref:Phospho-2-dehydro-3-deoxyheptonate aldolase n=1 Tax=Sporomusa acidovorans (strain ATCC 49682 / DSM 3132 / Mol) TaxID=1123286 RepID=A0ABZ3J363_SPOA4|nr:3-deoxy-7-phosphoheptulonate synthase [Sporomusa acidovorans]OZC20313.1 phospho-2-dehydro-3-deoxyheptonate aldolase [Sporomusa acidovorans DSM 3132]SDD38199.1 3-deoxy-D-arabinoheptulosonate-7-phosphate synthase [Sporomusa acidovorans]